VSRPFRVAEDVPAGTMTPAIAHVGKAGTWTLEAVLPRDVPAGQFLALVLGSRWVKGDSFLVQTDDPAGPDYLTARRGDGSTLEPACVTSYSATFAVPAKGLPRGERVRLVIGDTGGGGPGATPVGAAKGKTFLALDILNKADGQSHYNDHVGHYLAYFPFDYRGGALDRLVLLAPATVGVGEAFDAVLRPQDAAGTVADDRPERVTVTIGDRSQSITFTEADLTPAGTLRLRGLAAAEPGVLRIACTDPDSGLSAVSNPVRVVASPDGDQCLWGIIHEHTEISDGHGTLDRAYTNMRHGSALDYGAVSDHDHRYETPDFTWPMTVDAAKRHHAPGAFVTLLGYEWAKWRRNGDGDRNVYYPGDEGAMIRSETGEADTPPKLFAALADREAVVIPHHPAYGGQWCDFKDHDARLERLIEIYSVWGNSERSLADGNPLPVRGTRTNHPVRARAQGRRPGDFTLAELEDINPLGFVQRALAIGWRAGFTAGGDMHGAHPGDDVTRGHGPATYRPGLTALWAAERTREAVFRALRDRRTVATTGARIVVQFAVNGRPMGSEIPLSEAPGERVIAVEVNGTAPIDRIEVVRNNADVHTVAGSRTADVAFTWRDDAPFSDLAITDAPFSPEPFLFYYLRVTQADGQMAWASPVWIVGT